MKILIEVPYGTKLLVEASANSGALLQGITEATLVRQSGYGKDMVAEKVINQKINVEILPDEFGAKEADPVAALRKEKETADNRWIEYYHKANKFEAELLTLKKDLDERGIAYKKDEEKKI